MREVGKAAISIDPEVWFNEGATLVSEAVYAPDMLQGVLNLAPHR